MKFVIVIAASVASAVLVLPTVTQGQGSVATEKAAAVSDGQLGA